MLEDYYVKPATVDRVRASWLAPQIESYLEWLESRRYSRLVVYRRLPLLFHFAEFAQKKGCKDVASCKAYIKEFVSEWLEQHGAKSKTAVAVRKHMIDAECGVRQLLQLACKEPVMRNRRRRPFPLESEVPGFAEYLRSERGFAESTIRNYRRHLDEFAQYLSRTGITSFGQLSPAVLAAFIVQYRPKVAPRTRLGFCCHLRVLLRFCYRQGITTRDLSGAVATPQIYRLNDVPRSITWDDVRRMLEGVERRTIRGRRDYAILLLLVTYGLRAHEVARLTLDDVDWKRERLQVLARKAGHATVYPLAGVAAEAIIDYLKNGRPKTEDRHLFFRARAPLAPITPAAVSSSVALYLYKAGIQVPKAGSHTLRHTCVQRLIEAEFPLKDNRRLRRTSLAGVHPRLQQGCHSISARSRHGRRGGAMNSPIFLSSLAPFLNQFVQYKRALNRKYCADAEVLRLFDRYIQSRQITGWSEINSLVIDDFLRSHPRRVSARSYNHLLGTVHRFFKFAVMQQWIERNPVTASPRPETAARIPYLFDLDTAKQLLAVARSFPERSRARYRGLVYETIFALLYGLGLRVGEVVRLTLADVDFTRDLLLIRESKFQKTRIVPLGPNLARRLKHYVEERHGTNAAPERPLFSFTKRGCICVGTISQTFHTLLPRLHLHIPPGVSPPRLHDLRHSFAVATLLRWYRQGIDPNSRLMHLATFLGHVDPNSTAVYLTITEELLNQAARRFQVLAPKGGVQ